MSHIKKKHLVSIFCITVGASSTLAVGFWPQYAFPIEMLLYTFLVFGPLFLGLWSERNRRAFWICMSAAFAAHGAFLYLIRSTFPFSSVLIVVPIAVVEAAAIFAAMDRILSGRGAERPSLADSLRSRWTK